MAYRMWKKTASEAGVQLIAATIDTDKNNSMNSVVDSVLGALNDNSCLDKPLAIFGHSLGGIVGYEIARKLQALDCPPFLLMVSSVKSPEALTQHNVSDAPKRSLMSKEQLFDNIVSTGGLKKGVDPGFLKHSLGKMQKDFAIFDNYKLNDLLHYRLECPIVTFGGVQDEVGTFETMAPWQHYSESTHGDHLMPSHHSFADGDHMYFESAQYQEAVPQLVFDEIHSRISDRRPRAFSVVDGFI